MRHGRKRTSPGASAAISLAGVGIPILLWALGELSVHPPKIVVYALLALAVLLIVGPWVMIGIQRMRRGNEPRKGIGMTDDDAKVNIDQSVTSYHQSGGITARNVDLAPEPGVEAETLEENKPEGDEFLTRIRLVLQAAYAASGLRIDVSTDDPMRLDLHPGASLQDAGMMSVRTLADAPSHKVMELAPPLTNGYIASIYTSKPTAVRVAASVS